MKERKKERKKEKSKPSSFCGLKSAIHNSLNYFDKFSYERLEKNWT
jgi:hypothetical protein